MSANTITPVKCLSALAAAALLAAGCASPDVNPPQPASHTGYVDFRAEPPGALFWEVSRFDPRSQTFERVYSKLEPPQGGVLRLAFPPGRQRLQMTFLNRVVAQPAEIELEVQDGRITPVRVTLTEAGSTAVETREINMAAKSRHGRRTAFESSGTVQYRLSAMAGPPEQYQPKEQVPHAR